MYLDPQPNFEYQGRMFLAIGDDGGKEGKQGTNFQSTLLLTRACATREAHPPFPP